MRTGTAKPIRRFTKHFKTGRPLVLAADHPAVVEGRTIFVSRRRPSNERLLKSGVNQRKLGDRVVKGRWARMPIFSLTLEERATCPRACSHWRDCYGNHTHMAKRYAHGQALEEKLEVELSKLSAKYPSGFVVRLHILGDFYSVEYVLKWITWMKAYPNLHVFGYSARWIDEDIGNALIGARLEFPDRWWVRFSHHDEEGWLSTGDSGIICPVQTGKTDACGTCGLCWTVEKPIRFLVH